MSDVNKERVVNRLNEKERSTASLIEHGMNLPLGSVTDEDVIHFLVELRRRSKRGVLEGRLLETFKLLMKYGKI